MVGRFHLGNKSLICGMVQVRFRYRKIFGTGSGAKRKTKINLKPKFSLTKIHKIELKLSQAGDIIACPMVLLPRMVQ